MMLNSISAFLHEMCDSFREHSNNKKKLIDDISALVFVCIEDVSKLIRLNCVLFFRIDDHGGGGVYGRRFVSVRLSSGDI